MLSEDLQVFDHVPYRFDGKAQFAAYLAGAAEGIASMSFGFRQPSCRVLSDTTGIVNAYDSFTGVTKDGKVLTIHGRTTLVFVKRGGHRSSMPSLQHQGDPELARRSRMKQIEAHRVQGK
jgi:ketosteroid isomerase-like protein